MTEPRDMVFLFDVDNTLLDNDQVQADLRAIISKSNFGVAAKDRYWALLEDLRGELGYTDYLWRSRALSARTVARPRGCCASRTGFAITRSITGSIRMR